MSEEISGSEEDAKITVHDILRGLQERVSQYSANLLLESAMVDLGLEEGATLKKEEAKNLCLALIKKGGPAFQVGQAMYRRI